MGVRVGLIEQELSEQVIGAAIEVHRALGPGLLESTYRRCLMHELGLRGLEVQAEVPLDLNYKGLVIPHGYRLDLLVAQRMVIEVKVVEKLLPVHNAQLLTYLRLSQCRIGFLLNFKVAQMRDGLHRLVQ